MLNKMKYVAETLLVFLCLIFAYKFATAKPDVVVETVTDTLYVYDTVIIPDTVIVAEIEYVEVPGQIITETDTVYVTVVGDTIASASYSFREDLTEATINAKYFYSTRSFMFSGSIKNASQIITKTVYKEKDFNMLINGAFLGGNKYSGQLGFGIEFKRIGLVAIASTEERIGLQLQYRW
jgi:hypothetical protein